MRHGQVKEATIQCSALARDSRANSVPISHAKDEQKVDVPDKAIIIVRNDPCKQR